MSDHVQAHPLHWPEGRPRARRRQHAQFKTNMGAAIYHLMNEIRLLGGKQAVLSSDLELRLDGLPYAGQREPEDCGIAVYFTYKDKQHCFACDDWYRARDNVRAIGKTIEALRGISRWGTGDMMERAFQGFVALPAPEGEPWWSVLGFGSVADAISNGFEDRAKSLLQQYHPDKPDGDIVRFKQVVAARDSGRTIRKQQE